MPVQGFTEIVYVRSDTTTPGSSDKVDGISEFTFSKSRDMAETTDTKDGSGFKTRQAQLMDTKIDASGQYEASDAIQQLIRSSFDSGATLYITVHVDPSASSGSKGWRIPCLVESYEGGVNVNEPGKFSFSAVGNGTPVAV
jgi:hypothetical protein